MIKVKIKEIAEKNGVTTAYQLQKKLGIQPSLAAKWYRNDLKMIGIESLNSLCAAFKCLPSDILIYVADAESAQVSNTESSKPKESNTKSSISTVHNASDSSLNKPVAVLESEKGKSVRVAETVMIDGENYLTTADVAERLGLSKKSITDYINKGVLRSVQPRGERTPHLIAESAFAEFEIYYRNLTGKA
jgi:excisionase family DNA binding protein